MNNIRMQKVQSIMNRLEKEVMYRANVGCVLYEASDSTIHQLEVFLKECTHGRNQKIINDLLADESGETAENIKKESC